MRHVAGAALGVAIEQLATRRHVGAARERRDSRDRCRVAGLGPQTEQPAEVDERIADRRLLPVDDRDELDRQVRREHHVVELVVAVDDAGRLRGWNVRGEPLPRRVDIRERTRLVALELAEPARNLPLEVAVGLPEAVEPARAPVER